MKVDPTNRLVADTLETELEYQVAAARRSRTGVSAPASVRSRLNDAQSGQILALATNFREVWQNPALPHRERKRMIRLLIEDVTVVKRDSITLHVRFRGGAMESLTIPEPLDAWHRRRTSDSTVQEIDSLLDDHTCAEIAGIHCIRDGCLLRPPRQVELSRDQFVGKDQARIVRRTSGPGGGSEDCHELVFVVGLAANAEGIYRPGGARSLPERLAHRTFVFPVGDLDVTPYSESESGRHGAGPTGIPGPTSVRLLLLMSHWSWSSAQVQAAVPGRLAGRAFLAWPQSVRKLTMRVPSLCFRPWQPL